MQPTLTPAQITMARSLRGTGMSYPDIQRELGVDVQPSTIRAHCLDMVVPGERQGTRVDKPERARADGGVIRSFTDEEDKMLIVWALAYEDKRVNLNQLAGHMGRKRHSLAARIKTLKKHGKIPA